MAVADVTLSTLNRLQELIEINIDSEKGLQEAAATIKNPRIAGVFGDLAYQRRRHSEELKAQVRIRNEDPVQAGSTAASLHRWWLNVRGALTGGDDHAVLAEAERGEDAIKSKYEEVLTETTGFEINQLIREQYNDVVTSHNLIRDLRDLQS